jgi:hypothetical protein
MFGTRCHFRKMLTRSEERIAANILAGQLTRLRKSEASSQHECILISTTLHQPAM